MTAVAHLGLCQTEDDAEMPDVKDHDKSKDSVKASPRKSPAKAKSKPSDFRFILSSNLANVNL